MHTEVFNNIDTLINMAGASLNIDEINSELLTLKRQIKNKKNEIEDLKALITDARYFNASNELVDKNIEISLKNKITRLKRKLKEIKGSVQDIKSEEKTLHEEITTLKNKLTKNETYVVTLKTKVESSKNNDYYKALLKKEEENVKELNTELNKKNKAYENILKELELNNQAVLELNTKIENEETRLKGILDNLKNPKAYIDEDLKESDDKKLEALEEDLSKLEKRELELLTNALLIGTDAKELIANNNINEANEKIKELVTIVKTKPYMNITDLSILDEEIEKKESLRIELSNLIDSKNYEGINSNAIKSRIEYLNNEIEKNNKDIEEYQNKINEIDNLINNNLGKIISELEQEVIENEKTLSEYKTLVKDKNKTAKVRANIENAITKKEKEKKILDEILLSYKENLLAKIEKTNIIESIIKKLEEEKTLFNEELNKLEKLTMIDFSSKDLIAEEKDKEELKKLNEELKEIKERKKYDKTPDEIYDKIKTSLEALRPKQTINVDKKLDKALEIDSLFDPIPPKEKTNGRIKVIEMIPVETIKNTGGN